MVAGELAVVSTMRTRGRMRMRDHSAVRDWPLRWEGRRRGKGERGRVISMGRHEHY